MAQPTPLRSLPLPSGLISPSRIRSYLLRLPLFTRLTALLIVAFYLLEFQSIWPIITWGSLIPSRIGLFSGGMHRLNTYIIIHRGFVHMFLNLLALVPLMERFEKECGTLTSVALWAGPLATLPGGLYLAVERGVLGGDTGVCGASMPVFLLVASEGVRSWRVNPFFEIAGVKVPTWTTPIVLAVVTAILIPGTSLLGHCCALVVGYLWGLGYIRFLAPPDKVIRWIEGKLNLLGRVPHYVSVDQKTYGRYGVLPTSANEQPHSNAIGLGWVGTNNGGQRLGAS